MKTKFKGTPGKWKTYKGNDRWVVRGGNIVEVVHDGTRDGSIPLVDLPPARIYGDTGTSEMVTPAAL